MPREPRKPQDGDDHAAPVIPLHRARAALQRGGRPRRRAEELLDHPDPARHVPTLPVQELYYAVREVGLHDAGELVALASPEQVRAFFDFDAWERDRFLPEHAQPWFESLVDAGPEVLARAVRGLDGELVALYLRRQLRVYDLELDVPPEEPEGHYYPTPDTFFLLDVLPAGEHGKHVERLVDWLYRADIDLARRTLMAARAEMDSDLEEHAYRWRSGRMADLGYVDYYEALEVYRWLDPASVRLGEGTAEQEAGQGTGEVTLPPELVSSTQGGLLGRALAALEDPEELGRIASGLMLLANRVMSADRVEPGDLESASAALEQTAAWLELGLEFLCGQGAAVDEAARAKERVARAVEALGSVSLVRIFRVGHSLGLKLRRAADALLKEPGAWLSLRPGEASLLDSPLAELVAALRTSPGRKHPAYPVALDGVEARDARGGVATRPLRTLVDLARAARGLEEAAQLGASFQQGLGVEPRLLDEAARKKLTLPAEAITFATLGATLAANVLLARPASLVPLSRDDLPALRKLALAEHDLRPEARAKVQQALAARLAEREFQPSLFWPRWLDAWLTHLDDALRLSAQKPEAANLLVYKQ